MSAMDFRRWHASRRRNDVAESPYRAKRGAVSYVWQPCELCGGPMGRHSDGSMGLLHVPGCEVSPWMATDVRYNTVRTAKRVQS